MYAAYHGHHSVVNILIEHGAEADKQDEVKNNFSH